MATLKISDEIIAVLLDAGVFAIRSHRQAHVVRINRERDRAFQAPGARRLGSVRGGLALSR